MCVRHDEPILGHHKAAAADLECVSLLELAGVEQYLQGCVYVYVCVQGLVEQSQKGRSVVVSMMVGYVDWY